MVSAIRSWNANIVRIGLNEDCVLAVNGVPSAYAVANYMNAIKAFVDRLHARGMFAEVSLMWPRPAPRRRSTSRRCSTQITPLRR
jgi:endoglucanase